MSRWRADRMPAVTVPPSPNGLPIASTQSPTRALSLSPQTAAGSGLSVLTFSTRDVGLGVAADDLGLQIGVVVQDDGDLVGIGDDVVVGDDVAGRIDDEAGAERGRLARLRLGIAAALAAVIEEILEELLERRARRELRHVGARAARRRRSGFTVCVVEMLTTAGSSFAARSAKPSGAG